MNASRPTPDPPPVAFFANGIRARLGAVGGRCWLEVEFLDGHFANAVAALVEVLARPRDGHGLPQGLPCVIFSARWPLEQASRPSRSAFGWFPRGLTLEAARQCHYRITPITMRDQIAEQSTEIPGDGQTPS